MESTSADVLILIIFTAFWFYQLYKIWFRIDDEYEKALKRAKWIPKIFNTERYLVNDKATWVMVVRASSVLMTALIVLVNIILLPSLLFGK
jgi:hypothetical protein